jgi:hypothetical protein
MTSDGEISFLDLRTALDPNIARNGNQGSILAYSRFGRFLVTGLIGDTCNTGLESEIPDFSGRKTGLIIPYWMADRLPDGLE